MKQRKININKVIREIIKNAEYGVCDEKNLKLMWTREVIQIIKANIKETEEDNCKDMYNKLLQKYLELSDNYFHAQGKVTKIITAVGEIINE